VLALGRGLCIIGGVLRNNRRCIMDHLKEKWHVDETVIRSEEGWKVCETWGYFPEDFDGTKTLQYICDLHNATLK